MADAAYSFIIDSGLTRGHAVRLCDTLNTILSQHDYPQTVGMLLGEAVGLSALLCSSIKYDGVFSLQIQGDGPVSTLVVNQTSEGKIRGYARFDKDALQKAEQEQAEKKTAQVPAFFGRGALSFMVEQKGSSENYQGIIGLEQPTLTECVHQYFRDSEQIGTAVRLHIAPPDEKNGWRCGAIMIQKMPAAQKAASHLSEDEIEELWRTAVILLNSVTNEELVDTNLSVEKLVNRLYHLNDLQIFMPKLLEFGCRCSQEKVLEMLKSFPPQDIDDMIIDGKIIVDCQFCGRRYTLTSKDLSQENK